MIVVRMTFVKFDPQRIEEVRKIYNHDIAPVVREQEGNLGIRLLEPHDKAEDYISISEWKSQADAEAYDKTGIYTNLVKKLDAFVVKPAVLKTYTTEDVKVFTGSF
ncbi:MAG: antibiotic biosynthesis monooxygenase family protein [Candidatus Dadabacteria bacterium]